MSDNSVSSNVPTIDYEVHEFSRLSNRQLYDCLYLRQLVFVIEQDCPYLDIDGKDPDALHVLGSQNEFGIISYLRFFPPNDHLPETVIGRVVVHPKWRRLGLGRQLFERGVEFALSRFPEHPIKISAQQRLEAFYCDAGFVPFGSSYLEDGIKHIGMRRPPAR